MKEPLIGIKACVFDAYGTLFDFAAAARRCQDELGDQATKLTALWRDKQLQYTWLRAAKGRHADFWQVMGDVLDFALETLEIDRPSLRERLMELYLNLDAFPEVPEVLRSLRKAGLHTAILSNGSPRMLDAAVRGAGLDALFDHVLFGRGRRRLQAPSEGLSARRRPSGCRWRSISFQSSNAWDAYAASAFGMRVVWCNRYGQRAERLPGAPDREIVSLAELPALVGAG